MARIAVFASLLALAVLVAGVFGALHNQVSYTVGPDYFHQFKFQQFRISQDIPARLGAAFVGWQASWWMGLVVGIPTFTLGLILIPSAPNAWAAGLRAIGAVVILTAIASVIGLVFGLVSVNDQVAGQISVPDHIRDKVGFLRAGVMHDASYLGGIAGLAVAIWVMLRARRRGE